MSLFQYPLSRISASLRHHSLYLGAVMSALPTAASMMSLALFRFWPPSSAKSHPPYQPSCRPPAIGVTPIFLSAAHAAMNWLHVAGGRLGSRPAFLNRSLLQRSGNDGCVD